MIKTSLRIEVVTMHKYEKIARYIIQHIEAHSLTMGDQLPSLDEIITQFGYSKSTVIKALALLERAGIIYQVQGSGIYVRGHNRDDYINLSELKGFRSSMRHSQLTSKTITCALEEPSDWVKGQLNLTNQEKIYHIVRVRYLDGRPFCVEESHYSHTYVPYLDTKITNNFIFTYLSQNLNINFSFADKFIRICDLTSFEAEKLAVHPGEVGLVTEEKFYISDGTPVVVSRIIYPRHESKFFIQTNNHYSLMD